MKAKTLETLEQVERAHIFRAFYVLGPKRAAVADALGISKRTLYNKIHKYEVPDRLTGCEFGYKRGVESFGPSQYMRSKPSLARGLKPGCANFAKGAKS